MSAIRIVNKSIKAPLIKLKALKHKNLIDCETCQIKYKVKNENDN